MTQPGSELRGAPCGRGALGWPEGFVFPVALGRGDGLQRPWADMPGAARVGHGAVAAQDFSPFTRADTFFPSIFFFFFLSSFF